MHFLRAIEHALIDFGGVPEVVRHGTQVAIVRACLYDPDISEVYAAFAHHWGFVPLPARPRHILKKTVSSRTAATTLRTMPLREALR